MIFFSLIKHFVLVSYEAGSKMKTHSIFLRNFEVKWDKFFKAFCWSTIAMNSWAYTRRTSMKYKCCYYRTASIMRSTYFYLEQYLGLKIAKFYDWVNESASFDESKCFKFRKSISKNKVDFVSESSVRIKGSVRNIRTLTWRYDHFISSERQ